METNEDTPPNSFNSPEDVTEFESKMSKLSKTKSIPKKDAEKIKKALDKLSKSVNKLTDIAPVIEKTSANLYRNAWGVVYGKLDRWRQKEIDTTLKSGKLSDRDWDDDFVKRVIELAESNDFVQKNASASE